MRRDKLVVAAQILDSCNVGGSTKTRIAQNLNLNESMLKKFIDFLLREELIDAVYGSRTTYKTTPKGDSILKILKNIREALPELG